MILNTLGEEIASEMCGKGGVLATLLGITNAAFAAAFPFFLGNLPSRSHQSHRGMHSSGLVNPVDCHSLVGSHRKTSGLVGHRLRPRALDGSAVSAILYGRGCLHPVSGGLALC